MGKEKFRWRLARRHTTRLALASVLLGLVVLMVAVIATRQKASSPQLADPAKQAHQDVSSKLDKLDDSPANDQETVTVLKEYLRTNPPADYKYEAMMHLASAYFNVDDYDAAIAAYQKVDTTDKHIRVAILQGLANAYIAKKDYPSAAKSLREAVELQKANGDYDTMRLATDESILHWLEEQQ